jgi:hypothetical protein
VEVRAHHASTDEYRELVFPLELAKTEAKPEFFRDRYVAGYRWQAMQAGDEILSKLMPWGMRPKDPTVPYDVR